MSDQTPLETKLTFHKVNNSLPNTLQPNAFYLVRKNTGGFVEGYLTDNNGDAALRLINNPLEFFNADGIIDKPLKIWRGSTLSVKGVWSIDYSSAGFTEPPEVIPVATAGTKDDAEDGKYASVSAATITATGCSGRANNAVAAGALVAMVNTNADTVIRVIAIGV